MTWFILPYCLFRPSRCWGVLRHLYSVLCLAHPVRAGRHTPTLADNNHDPPSPTVLRRWSSPCTNEANPSWVDSPRQVPIADELLRRRLPHVRQQGSPCRAPLKIEERIAAFRAGFFCKPWRAKCVRGIYSYSTACEISSQDPRAQAHVRFMCRLYQVLTFAQAAREHGVNLGSNNVSSREMPLSLSRRHGPCAGRY